MPTHTQKAAAEVSPPLFGAGERGTEGSEAAARIGSGGRCHRNFSVPAYPAAGFEFIGSTICLMQEESSSFLVSLPEGALDEPLENVPK